MTVTADTNTEAVVLFGESYHHPNVFYRTKFLVPDPVVVVDGGGEDVVLWTSVMEAARAQREASVRAVRSTSELEEKVKQKRHGEQDGWGALVAAICEEHGLTCVTVDSDFPALIADQLREQGVTVRARADLYRRERRIKTAEEMEKIAATEIAGMEGLQRAIDLVASAEIRDGLLWREGRPMSGNDLVLAVETRLLELGCTTTDSICCGGPESADPHRTTSPVLRAGLPIVLDIYPFDKTTRYWGDMTRTVVRGTPPPEVEAMWEATLEAQQAGLDAVSAGVNGRDVHYACCEVYARRGYGSLAKPYRHIESEAKFIHGTGHGLGLEIHEFPRVGDVDVTLEVGDVITVEPGLYDPRLGGVRIEDLVVVTAEGCRNLTTLPKVFRLD
ncbi:MAG TPA: Xaa-Pro peptidase family protein [Candidatus Sulfotelmatobacter sp.]|nr:Xaa-Pro peptidase family protein [Candidatus Sulfotelmatobacter sp.]